MAAAIVHFMYRHRLTRSCVNDLCHLLKVLNVPNVPKSFSVIKRLLTCDVEDPKGKEYTICSECDKLSTESTRCLNQHCTQHDKYDKVPIRYLSLSISSQLRSILKNSNGLLKKPNAESDLLTDIVDGYQYKHIMQNENGPFITLCMNVDGVQVSDSSNQSLWITTLVINELPRVKRFKQENVIVAGIATVSSKPNRAQMQVMLRVLAHQLKVLENGITIQFRDVEEVVMRVYLICACLDKPAQSIVQNTAEPIGGYGCGRCIIKGNWKRPILCSRKIITALTFLGQTVPSSQHSTNHIRVFPIDRNTTITPRNNELYDSIIDSIPDEGKSIRSKKDDELKGYRGPCVLRELKYFDVGISFLSDSLHNCYHGAAVR